MADRFRLTLAQLNATVGDLAGNAERARHAWDVARAAGSDMVALPEMFITGYNPQDLVMKPAFHQAAIAVIEQLARDCADGPAIAIGGPALEGVALHNAYYILQGGRVTARVFKHHLPNETVFDEKRLYTSGDVAGPYTVGPVRIGSPVCEDAWHEDVAETLARVSATSSCQSSSQTGLPLVYLNLVGGQDDQIFDGGSFVLNPGGALALQLPMFEEAIAHVDFTCGPDGWHAEQGPLAHLPDELEQDYNATVLALRDYLRKAGFSRVLLGLSGGVDSAIVAAIAVDALGAENVRCVMLPSEYTSQASLDDAQAVAENLGCHYDFVPIDEGRAAITATLVSLFEGQEPDVTEENLQSRLRGLLLMALSNKFGEMLLTTGNKSEVAVGYATIYGDMAGGYNPIKDLYKTRVFDLCRWRNAHHRDWMKGPAAEVIPPRVIDKPPSAELAADQKDSDSLPDYPVLDAILNILVDEDGSISDCVAAGYDAADAQKVEHLLYISEYKRFQAAPGARLSKRAFWLDRRYPIVNRWRDRSAPD